MCQIHVHVYIKQGDQMITGPIVIIQIYIKKIVVAIVVHVYTLIATKNVYSKLDNKNV